MSSFLSRNRLSLIVEVFVSKHSMNLPSFLPKDRAKGDMGNVLLRVKGIIRTECCEEKEIWAEMAWFITPTCVQIVNETPVLSKLLMFARLNYVHGRIIMKITILLIYVKGLTFQEGWIWCMAVYFRRIICNAIRSWLSREVGWFSCAHFHQTFGLRLLGWIFFGLSLNLKPIAFLMTAKRDRQMVVLIAA